MESRSERPAFNCTKMMFSPSLGGVLNGIPFVRLHETSYQLCTFCFLRAWNSDYHMLGLKNIYHFNELFYTWQDD